jgi:tetratricopeptide (TPR) repeat protein
MTSKLFDAVRSTATLSLIAIALCVISVSAQPPKAKTEEPGTAAFNKGKLQSQRRDYDGAIASFTKAIELDPKRAEVYVQRGIALRMSGRLDQAIDDFEKATELNPQLTQNNRVVAQAYTNQGEVLVMSFEIERAITDFDKALKLFPEDLRPYFDRAEARLFLEDYKGALADYDSFLAKQNSDPFYRARTFFARGFTKHLLGREAEADADMKEGTRLADKMAPDLLMSLEFLARRLEAYKQINQQKRKSIG